MMMSDVEAQDVFSLSPTSESESMADIGFRAAHSLDIVPAHKNPKSLHANPRGKIYLFQRYSPFRSGPTACGILVYIIYMHTHTHIYIQMQLSLSLSLPLSLHSTLESYVIIYIYTHTHIYIYIYICRVYADAVFYVQSFARPVLLRGRTHNGAVSLCLGFAIVRAVQTRSGQRERDTPREMDGYVDQMRYDQS